MQTINILPYKEIPVVVYRKSFDTPAKRYTNEIGFTLPNWFINQFFYRLISVV